MSFPDITARIRERKNFPRSLLGFQTNKQVIHLDLRYEFNYYYIYIYISIVYSIIDSRWLNATGYSLAGIPMRYTCRRSEKSLRLIIIDIVVNVVVIVDLVMVLSQLE